MASYEELFALRSNSELLNKLAIACADQANVIRLEDGGTANHANRLKWAKEAFIDPRTKAEEMLCALLVINKALTAAQILSANDAALLNAVATAVDIFATGSEV